MYKSYAYLFVLSFVFIGCSSGGTSQEEIDVSELPVYLEMNGNVNYIADFKKNNESTTSILDHAFVSSDLKKSSTLEKYAFTRIIFDQYFSTSSIDTGRVFLRIYIGDLFLGEGEYSFNNYKDFRESINSTGDLGYNKNMITAEFSYWQRNLEPNNSSIVSGYYVSESGQLNTTVQEDGELLTEFSINFALVNHLSSVPSFSSNKLTVTGRLDTGELEGGYGY